VTPAVEEPEPSDHQRAGADRRHGSSCGNERADERRERLVRIGSRLPEIAARQDEKLNFIGSDLRELDVGKNAEATHRQDRRASEANASNDAMSPPSQFGERVGRLPISEAVEDNDVRRFVRHSTPAGGREVDARQRYS
jgi:hypothetical protein